MSNILIVTTGLTGILNSSFQVIDQLKNEGHHITYASIRDVRDKVERHGLHFVQLPDINRFVSFRYLDNGKSRGYLKSLLFHLLHYKKQLTQGVVECHYETYETIINKLNPDVILVDEEIHEVILVAYKLDLPILLLGQFFSCRMHKNLPQIRTTIIPGKGFDGSIMGIKISWLFVKLKIVVRNIISSVTLRNNRRSIIFHYAKSINFPTDSLISRNFPSVFIHKHLPILSMTMKSLEFPHNYSNNFQYIGAKVFDKRNDTENNNIVNEKLDKIFVSKHISETKIIYCSITSMKQGGDDTFISKVITAVSNRKAWQLIVSLGGNSSLMETENLPKNVHLFNWVPQLKVLKQTDCSINHGGIHTINECIHFGVPMLVYSGKRYDQNGNAARIHYHNVGIRGDKDKETPEDIRANIEKILTDNSYLENTKFIQEKYFKIRENPLSPLLQNSVKKSQLR